MPTTAVGRKSSSIAIGESVMFGAEARARLRKLNLRLPDTTRGELSTGGVVQGDLSELRKIEHRVLQNAVLLPLSKVGIGEISRNRLKNVDVCLNVESDLFSHATRDVFVACYDRSSSCVAKRVDRDRAVHHKRQDAGSRQEDHETGRNPSQLLDLAGCGASRQSGMDGRMSVFGGATTWNRLLTARVICPSARKMAGGSSKLCT